MKNYKSFADILFFTNSNKDDKNLSYTDAEAHIENGAFQEVKGCSPPSEKNPDRFFA